MGEISFLCEVSEMKNPSEQLVLKSTTKEAVVVIPGLLRPLKMIRKNCLECCCNQHSQVRFCPITECPLWRLRFGAMPQTVIRREGPAAKDLFNPISFRPGGKYGQSEDAEAQMPIGLPVMGYGAGQRGQKKQISEARKLKNLTT